MMELKKTGSDRGLMDFETQQAAIARKRDGKSTGGVGKLKDRMAMFEGGGNRTESPLRYSAHMVPPASPRASITKKSESKKEGGDAKPAVTKSRHALLRRVNSTGSVDTDEEENNTRESRKYRKSSIGVEQNSSKPRQQPSKTTKNDDVDDEPTFHEDEERIIKIDHIEVTTTRKQSNSKDNNDSTDDDDDAEENPQRRRARRVGEGDGQDTEDEYVPGGGYRGTFMDWEAQQRAIVRRREPKKEDNKPDTSKEAEQPRSMGGKVSSIRNIFDKASDHSSRNGSFNKPGSARSLVDKNSAHRSPETKAKPVVSTAKPVHATTTPGKSHAERNTTTTKSRKPKNDGTTTKARPSRSRQSVDDSIVDYSSGDDDDAGLAARNKKGRRRARRRNSFGSQEKNENQDSGGNNTEDEYVWGGGFRGTFMNFEAQQRAIARRRDRDQTKNDQMVGSVRNVFEKNTKTSTNAAPQPMPTSPKRMGEKTSKTFTIAAPPPLPTSPKRMGDKVLNARSVFEKNAVKNTTSPSLSPSKSPSKTAGDKVNSMRNIFEAKTGNDAQRVVSPRDRKFASSVPTLPVNLPFANRHEDDRTDSSDDEQQQQQRGQGNSNRSGSISSQFLANHHAAKDDDSSSSSDEEQAGEGKTNAEPVKAISSLRPGKLRGTSFDDAPDDEPKKVEVKEISNLRPGTMRGASFSTDEDEKAMAHPNFVSDGDGASDEKERTGNETDDEYKGGGGYRGTFMDFDAQQRAIARKRQGRRSGAKKSDFKRAGEQGKDDEDYSD